MVEDLHFSYGKILLSVFTGSVGFCVYLYKYKHKVALSYFLTVVFLSLLGFGFHSLYEILMGIAVFDNSKRAYHHLVKELKLVEVELKKLGIPFDKLNIKLNDSNEE
ncbi:uncharacterized protein TA08935 [Theileria annulata]|uniref:Dolichol-phosphate mannosyltransferase subunit 3 n=1 Tax=Theileria annulata TaxID=5874 RepID=Q4U9D7_THEAN|nr:uncharacterized protein TA08935 [Theileria annulata]CAI76566.1 hypothetical protein TA08935 [Theileria annulata]|eukprot:XP_953191.1 hypothetical protein TA08935 [Theileria annulata]